MKKLLKSKKALSPVVAAIILIAVTVAVSIAVAAWMGSLTFTFMNTEELKITSVTFDTTSDIITVNYQNTGTSDVTVSGVTVTGGNVTSASLTEETLEKGTSGSISVQASDNTIIAGTTYNVELLSTKGNKFSYTETA
jgi:flagellin-like protein